MPKSTGPLLDQITGASQASSAPGMTDNTTSAADKLGANKSTNAIPNEVRLYVATACADTTSLMPYIVPHILYQASNTITEPQHNLLRRCNRQAIQF